MKSRYLDYKLYFNMSIKTHNVSIKVTNKSTLNKQIYTIIIHL